MEQLLILVVVGFIALVKWLLENYGRFTPDRDRSTPPEEDEPLRRQSPPPRSSPGRVETEEEARVRRFMEALGLPAGEEPPARRAPSPLPSATPPMQRRVQPSPSATPPPLNPQRRGPAPAAPRTPHPAPRTPTVLAPHRPPPSLEPVSPVPASPSTGEANMPIGEVFNAFDTTLESASSKAQNEQDRKSEIAAFAPREEGGSLLPDLRGAVSLRRAFILREVLGPPKALQ